MQAVAQTVGSAAVAYGCAASCVVSAESFVDYTTANPSQYADGTYAGLTAQMVAQNDFRQIIVGLNAVNF